jgi:hypothetical protein
VETKSTIKHANTGEVYASEEDAKTDINNPATNTTEQDIKETLRLT